MNFKEIFDILFSRKVMVFAGEYGRAKTLSMITYCFFAACLNHNNRFLTNIPFKLPITNIKYVPLIQTKQFDDDNKKTIIVLDEMQRDLNSREFLSGSVKTISKFSVNLRKDDAQLIGTIQFLDRLEKSLNELLQIIIIPTFINHYSNLDSKDVEIRLKNKDFKVEWLVIDRKYNDHYNMKINLYEFLNMYNTNFKPLPLIINDNEYLEKQEKNLSKSKFENLIVRNNEKINLSINNFKSDKYAT